MAWLSCLDCCMSWLPCSMQSSQMYDPSSPLMSRPTSLDFLPQNEQDGSSLLWLGILPRWTGFPCNANLGDDPVSYTHLRAHETRHDLVCRLLLEKKKKNKNNK